MTQAGFDLWLTENEYWLTRYMQGKYNRIKLCTVKTLQKELSEHSGTMQSTDATTATATGIYYSTLYNWTLKISHAELKIKSK